MAESAPEPLVSIISPFFNRRRYYPSLIESLKAQTFQGFEFIVVDDGSTDGLSDAIADTPTRFPTRLIRLSSNQGAASARNIGIESARAKYIALLDSDDTWYPEKLELQVRQLEKRPSDVKLVSLTRQVIRNSRSYVAPVKLMTETDSVGNYLFKCQGIIQSSMMMLRRNLAASVRFDEESRGHDDWSFALRLEAAGAHFEMLPQPLTIYDDQGGRIRRSPSYSHERLKWLAKHRNLLGDQPYWAAVAAVASRLPRETGRASLELIVEAYKHGAIGADWAAYYSLALYFPLVRTILRNAAKFSRSGSSVNPDPSISGHGVALASDQRDE